MAGIPVVIATNGIGIPVTEATNGIGVPVEIATNGMGTPIVVVPSGGMAVVGSGGGTPALPYDPVVIFMGDSQALTQGDTTNADTLVGAWTLHGPRVQVADTTLSGAFVQYLITTVANAAAGRSGLNFTANKNQPGPEIGFIPKFIDAYSNTLRLVDLSAPGSACGRGAVTGTFTGYVSSGTGNAAAGNVLTLSTGAFPNAGTLITEASIPASTVTASFGPGGSTRYIFQAGVSGFGLSFATTSAPTPVTITKYDGYSYDPIEGTLYSGSDGNITNGYKSRAINAVSAVSGAKVPIVVLLLGTNDMGNSTGATFFSAAMLRLIARIKADLAPYLTADYKIVMVRAKTGAAGSTTVRAAQQSIADNDANVYLLDADAVTLSDGTHYTCPTAPRVYTGRALVGSAAYDIFSGASSGI